jgi:hypothetical protein
MKTIKFGLILLIPAVLGSMITSCKKESNSSSTGTLTNQQVAQVQNSDVQDALAEKTDQDVDNSIDQLQASNYKVPSSKFLSASGSLVITVDHPDSTTFPKVITLVYTNFQDSTSDESFVRNGAIDVIVNATGNDDQLISWDQTFKHFSVTTDSTTFTVDGTRLIQRTAHTFQFSGQNGLRITNTASITGSLSYAITKTGASDTLKFTRVLARERKAFLHFDNIGGPTWAASRFRYNLSKDTITWTGTVTGINEDGNPYTKTVGVSTPLVVTFYLRTPIISSGTLEYTFTGTNTASYTITFRQDPNYPRFTQVTVTDNTTMNTFTFDRRFGRKFRRWW